MEDNFNDEEIKNILDTITPSKKDALYYDSMGVAHETKNLKESELTRIEESDITIKVKHAYCPVCGKELTAVQPIMYNPYTGEKKAILTCDCQNVTIMDSIYPKLVYYDKDGKEIKIFAE